MTQFNHKLAEVAQRSPRYAYEAYEFVFHGLAYAQKLLGREPPEKGPLDPAAEEKHHVSGPELLEGIRRLALREFGLMARVVFHQWGIHRTDDFGEIVFTLIDAGLMSRTSEDRLDDFRGVFDLDEGLLKGFHISVDEVREA